MFQTVVLLRRLVASIADATDLDFGAWAIRHQARLSFRLSRLFGHDFLRRGLANILASNDP